MKKSARRIILPFIVVLIALLLFAGSDYYLGIANPYRYNLNESTDKPTGNYNALIETSITTVSDAIDASDAVFRGRVVSSGEAYSYKGSSAPFTAFEVEVDHLLYGESPDTLTVIQAGEPGSDRDEIQLTFGDTFILFASQVSEGVYRSVCYENGIFRITPEGVYSLSNLPNLAIYDGTNPRVLESDVRRISVFGK